MSDTNFTPRVTRIVSTWLQDVNDAAYRANSAITGVVQAAWRTTLARNTDNIGLKDCGAVGDDATDNSTNVQALVTANPSRCIRVPKGTFRLGTVLTLPAAGIALEGEGYDSVLKVNATNQVLLQMVSGGWLKLHNLRLVGDGTATGSSNGIGLLTDSCEDVDLDTVWFENFGFFGWRYQSLTTQMKRIRGRNLFFLGNKSGAAGESADIYLRGKFSDAQFANITMEAASVNPITNGFMASQDAAGEQWDILDINGIVVRGGHVKRGINFSSEINDSTFQSGKASLRGAKVFDTGASAFKAKNIDRLEVSDFYCENCDDTPESAGSVQGSVLINGVEDFTGSNIIVKDAGTDGIRFLGRTGGSAAGVGRAKQTLTGFICDTADEAGVYVGFCIQDCILNAPQINDTGGPGIRIQVSTGLATPTNVIINSPRIRRTTGSNAGIRLGGLTGENIGKVIINSPDISQSGGYGIDSEFVNYFQLNGGEVLDSGAGGVNTSGVKVTQTAKAKITGTRASNDATTDTDWGLELTATNVAVEVLGMDLRNNAVAPVLFAAPTTYMLAANNAGWVTKNTGTGSVASGATTAVITHGLIATPAAADISVVFTEQGTADYGRWWISTITSTQFTVNVSADPGASNLDFSWSAVVYDEP